MRKRPPEIADRFGKGIKVRKIGNIEYSAYVPNILTFKSIQIKICGWIKPDPTATQEFYDKQLYLVRHRIRTLIRLWARTNGYFEEECIVDIETSPIKAKGKIKPKQFLKIDIGLFTKPSLTFEKEYVSLITENLSNRIIEKLEETPDTWNFIEYENHNKRLKNEKLNV